MEQIARDARISTQYEGTTGVQALDLIGRKILTSKPPLKLLTGYLRALRYVRSIGSHISMFISGCGEGDSPKMTDGDCFESQLGISSMGHLVAAGFVYGVNRTHYSLVAHLRQFGLAMLSPRPGKHVGPGRFPSDEVVSK